MLGSSNVSLSNTTTLARSRSRRSCVVIRLTSPVISSIFPEALSSAGVAGPWMHAHTWVELETIHQDINISFQSKSCLRFYISLYLEVHDKGVDHSQLRAQLDHKVFAIDSKVIRMIWVRFCRRPAEKAATGGGRAAAWLGALGKKGILDTNTAWIFVIFNFKTIDSISSMSNLFFFFFFFFFFFAFSLSLLLSHTHTYLYTFMFLKSKSETLYPLIIYQAGLLSSVPRHPARP